MTRPTTPDGARVERRKPEQMVDAHLAAAERAKRRAAMAKLTSAPGGRDVWNALRSVRLACEASGCLKAQSPPVNPIGTYLVSASDMLEQAVEVLGGGALLAATEKEGKE